jgi:hypothetical protein
LRLRLRLRGLSHQEFPTSPGNWKLQGKNKKKPQPIKEGVLVKVGDRTSGISNFPKGIGNFRVKTKKPQPFKEGVLYKSWRRHTLPDFTPVPSAQAGLTTLFGMGRGGHYRYNHLKIVGKW